MKTRDRQSGWGQPVPDLDSLEYIVDDYGVPPSVHPSYGENTLFEHTIRLAPHEAYYAWGCFYVLVDEEGKPWPIHDELTPSESEAVINAVSRCIERERTRRDKKLPLITAHQIWLRSSESQERFRELTQKLVMGELESLPASTPSPAQTPQPRMF